MQPEEVRSGAQARAIVEDRGLQHVKVGIFDNDGILRGKYIEREKFFAALEKGMGFCDVVLGWDSNDQQYDNITFTGWHTAFPDAAVRLPPETCRALPLEGSMLLFLGEFAGHAEEVCPRATLRRVLQRAAAMGYGAAAAAEYEFFLFSETPASVREKNYRGLTNLTPGYFGYSVLRSSVHAELYQALMHELLALVASTVNSYTRLVPGFWAPTAATWGVENRTCALRVIQGGARSQRVEYRIAAADINPYLALAAAIGSGLWGIEHRIEPDEPISGNAYDRKLPAERQLPRTLSEAAERLAHSAAAQELLGTRFVEDFAASRRREEREFRRAVTDWELARYFEII